jgi:ribonuclease T2
MSKAFRLFFLLTLVLFAREERFASQACPAFNNMKHSKNTHNVILDTTKKYTVLRQHKGQHLILVKGETPAQRWVDDECFSTTKQTEKAVQGQHSVDAYIRSVDEVEANVRSSKQNLLVLSWHNAFCETHRYKKECKRTLFTFGKGKYKEKHFVLHGLWPQPKGKQYCGVSSYDKNLDKHKQWHKLAPLELRPELKSRLQKVMPGFSSNLHKHEWVKHGTCYSKDANDYYEDAVGLTEQFNASKVGQFFGKHIGQRVTLQQIRTYFERSFGQGTGKRVEMKCKKGLVTELWLHLGSDSDDLGTLLKRGKKTRSYCTGGRIDKAGFNG